ncbi:MAG: hypothetical protein ACXW3Z_08695 [Limisphaerales bacterium]
MKTKSKWLKPTRLVPLVLITFAILGAVAYRFASKSGLSREMAAIRAKGLPTNPKELDAWYAAVPTGENAGLKFLEAYKLFVEGRRARSGDRRMAGDSSRRSSQHHGRCMAGDPRREE